MIVHPCFWNHETRLMRFTIFTIPCEISLPFFTFAEGYGTFTALIRLTQELDLRCHFLSRLQREKHIV